MKELKFDKKFEIIKECPICGNEWIESTEMEYDNDGEPLYEICEKCV